ncbi:MAG: polyphosphate kinase 1, partial [Bacteroidota bacterium]
MEQEQARYISRDLSWLSFNHRVLQEAADPHVPLYERIKFLAIYSSNLDEFARVRVSSLRSFKKLRKKTREKMDIKPKKALKEIQRIIQEQQEWFGEIFRDQIIPQLADRGIHLLDEQALLPEQQSWAESYFTQNLQSLVKAMWIRPDQPSPFLQNRALYLIIQFAETDRELAIVEIPSQEVDRFILLPGSEQPFYVAFLDDILRINLPSLFPENTITGAYAIKMSRDAEMYIDDEFSGNLLDKIRQGLSERDLGLPTRFLYDERMPQSVLELLKEIFRLRNNDLVAGAKYHNFHDFHGFPKPVRDEDLSDPPMPALAHPSL